MKKITVVLCVVAAVAALLCSSGIVSYADDSAEGSITVFNWGEYISDGSEGSLDVIKDFETETGIKVNYVNYASNEDMYASLKSGASNYDVIIPSDYMIARLAAEGMLLELDYNNIPNYANIEDSYKSQYYDTENKYTVPYNVGLVGIIYNKNKVEGTPDSWDLMWDEKYKGSILQFNNSRDAFATAQFKLGLDVNSSDIENNWKKAYEELIKQKAIIKGNVMDEIFVTMEGEDAAVASYYAGDFFKMYSVQPNLMFYYPKEGTNIFIDCMCVPKNCTNKAGAEAFINYMCGEKAAIANAEFICYASPNKLVKNNAEYKEWLTELHEDAYDILYGIDEEYINEKCQYYHDLPENVRTEMNTLWSNYKSYGSGNVVMYIIGGVVIAGIAVALISSYIRKKKREKVMNSTDN